MRIGKRDFQTSGHTYVMGILNVTPDSFSDGNKWTHLDTARRHVEEMITEGADLIDIGGESTRPGYTLLPDDVEMERVLPAIEMVKQEFDFPVSVDTYKSKVARAAIAAGADLVNDIWGLKYDAAMADLIAGSGVACCLMHNREQADYTDFLSDLLSDLGETITIAGNAGISSDRIILDPGIGFGKTYVQNLFIINHLEALRTSGYPILLGASRKSVIGQALNLPPSQRLEGSLATTVFAVQKGAMFVRVHDVQSNVRIIKMTEALLNG